MRRLTLFFGLMSWWMRLQILVMILFLASQYRFDFRKGLLPVTVAIVVIAWLIGWLLMRLMIAHPRTSFKIWSSLAGLILFVLMTMYVQARGQRWWFTLGAHFGREIVIGLYLSCGYWFLSELRLQQDRPKIEADNEQDIFPSAYDESRLKNE
jgi:hypothetical protein